MAPEKNFRSLRLPVLTGRLVLMTWLLAGSTVIAPLMAGSTDNSPVDQVERLSPTEAGERIDVLRTQLAYHDELYFKKSAPVISDNAYDQLKRELAALEQAFPQATQEGEDEQPPGIGDDRVGSFATYRHRMRMLSLNKSYTEAELRAFDARLKKQLGQGELDYVVEPKFDGLAISVTFEKGKLVRAVTRGNGVEGDDVTANLLTIRTLPRSLRATTTDGVVSPIPEVIELRGEVYLSFAEFNRINREREGAGESPFAIPRNLAAGTLKQLDPVEVTKRKLEIVFYGVGACESQEVRPDSQLAFLHQLHAWGLPTIETPRSVRGADAMWQAVQALGRERMKLGFPIDGAVVKLNSVALQDQMGVTTQAPLWAMAYKFVPKKVESQIKAITLQVGRTGVLTPVAELVPVKLGGSTIARVSLFNRDEIARRDIRVGDFVCIEKAGEIIPAIASVDRVKRTPEIMSYVFPADCPVCHTSLIQAVGEAAMRCPNFNCAAQVKRRIEHFASAACVNISGLGPAMVDKLVQKGWVKNVADLYRLRREDLLSLGGNVEKSSDRLLAAIEQSKHAELWRFIHGLGIPQIGAVTARDLARHFHGLAELAGAKRGDFIRGDQPLIPGVGESVSRAVFAYFNQVENRSVVENLLASGVNPTMAAVASTGKLWEGKVFVLTGTLPNLPRAEAIEKIQAAGGTVASSVSRKTDWILAGEGGGSKIEAARSLGIAIIGEAEFLGMLAAQRL
jgi:DNA ligase (NAD+)